MTAGKVQYYLPIFVVDYGTFWIRFFLDTDSACIDPYSTVRANGVFLRMAEGLISH